jgi:formylglycine-generating enzyme required for sulfatase activity
MVEVEGDYCPYVFQYCRRWIDPVQQMQCAEFAPSGPCLMPTEHRRFCIDRYEWPNVRGTKPVFMASWNDAKAACEGVKKRLCTDSEWTVACEGRDHLPYPYGYTRDARACNIDKPHPDPNPQLLYSLDAAARDAELARLDQREASGARAACVSPFGVYDMAGNVDEWVVNETQKGWPFQSGLKGGYWGPVRDRCRPMTTGHDESFRYYEIGFRCCDAAR